MTRALCLAFLAFFLTPPVSFPQTSTTAPPRQNQQNQPKNTDSPPANATSATPDVPQDEMPPEEDEEVAPEKFTLNPLESDRNIRVGNYYWHKGKYRAALGRYERATKYNPSSAEAFFKVGETEEKLKNKDAAKIAFQRVVQLSPDSKLAQEAKKKLKG